MGYTDTEYPVNPVGSVRTKALGGGGIFSLLRSPEAAFVLSYLTPLRMRLVWLAVLAFAVSALEGLRMVCVLALLHWIIGGTAPAGAAGVLGFRFTLPFPQAWILPGTLAVVLIQEAVEYWQKHLAAMAQRDLVERLRADSVERLLRMPLTYFTQTQSGASAYLINSQVSRFSAFIPRLADTARSATTLLILLGMLGAMQPLWTGAVAVGSLVIGMLLRPLYSRLATLGIDLAGKSTEAAALVQDAIRGIKLVKTCQTEAYERDKATRASVTVANLQVQAGDVQNLAKSLGRVLGFAMLIGVAGAAVVTGSAFVRGTLLAYLVLLIRALPITGQLAEARMSLTSLWGHVAQVMRFHHGA